MENQFTDSKSSYRFPIEQELSVSYLKENFWKCNFTSAEYPFQYWIILPNSVKPTSIETKEIKGIGLTIIGQYTRIDDSPYLEVSVAYEFCKYEMNASDWLQKKLYQMGEQIINYREIDGKSTGKYLDILTFKIMHSGEQVVSRFTCLKDYDKEKMGANYFCVKVSCLANDYDDLALTILQIATNWDLLNKSDWQMAESIIPFEFDFNEKILFYYPSSWEAGIENQSTPHKQRFIFRHDVMNLNKGILNMIVYPINLYEKPEKVFVSSIENFNNIEGTTINYQPIQELENTNPFIKTLYFSSGTIENMNENFYANLQSYIFNSNSNWFVMLMIGPKPNFENHFWEINKRMTEIIIESFNNLKFQKKEITQKKNNDEEITIEKPFRTHEGKNYTQEEWEKYEAEQWKKFKDK
jgi:hypothetical protein